MNTDEPSATGAATKEPDEWLSYGQLFSFSQRESVGVRTPRKIRALSRRTGARLCRRPAAAGWITLRLAFGTVALRFMVRESASTMWQILLIQTRLVMGSVLPLPLSHSRWARETAGRCPPRFLSSLREVASRYYGCRRSAGFSPLRFPCRISDGELKQTEVRVPVWVATVFLPICVQPSNRG